MAVEFATCPLAVPTRICFPVVSIFSYGALGATHIYIAPNAPYEQMDTTGKHIRVGTINGQVENSTAMSTLPIPQVKAEFPTEGYTMPTFTNTLIGVGPICDAYCTVVFKKEDVTVLSPKREPILQGWREENLPRLWRVA